jgi:hypothetical protein
MLIEIHTGSLPSIKAITRDIVHFTNHSLAVLTFLCNPNFTGLSFAVLVVLRSTLAGASDL